MRNAALALSLCLFGCTEYDLYGKEDDNPGTDTGVPSGGTDDGTDGGSVAVEEICNGEDDDGDGEIDEGFEDIDADGIADCVDDDCDADAPAGGAVDVVEACLSFDPGEVADPWDLSVEWEDRGVGTSVGGEGIVDTRPLIRTSAG